MTALDAREQPRSDPVPRHRAEFAKLLKQTRIAAGLSVRKLAQATHYSHTYIVRATTGERLPNWPLTKAYLGGCGINGADLDPWRELWGAAKSQDSEFRAHEQAASAGLARTAEWTEARSAVKRIVPLVTSIQRASTLRELGEALRRLAGRKGLDSLRAVEAATGVPRATLQGWYAGERLPQRVSLEGLVVQLGATDAERVEFVRCLTRIGDREACDGFRASTGHVCILSPTHRGMHRAADDTSWLDGDDLD